ncbi:MAG: DUF1501 domain-containing protein [Pseudanabaenaceae cyanobacterium SKYGB_i_bin29]|nr:DUF1501 domain-containing protein [Pseudanabaenaceae cyanobacterium SKYG29]MDW8420491.1 DUF1501 domain-containing protein [Pseudanabaenaceae cyanobacterium SKYGB_i_bin29]
MKRRTFFTLAALTTFASIWQARAQNLSSKQRTLLVVQLVGGNDGLNTCIPYRDPNYIRLRPSLAIKDGIPITSQIALHPSLEKLKPLFDAQKLTIVQNVSYPNPSLSHFRSQDIWQSGQLTEGSISGWLARYLSTIKADTADAVFIGDEYPLALLGAKDERYLQLSPNLRLATGDKVGRAVQVAYNVTQSHPLAEVVRQAVLAGQAAVDQFQSKVNQKTNSGDYPQDNIGNQFAFASVVLEALPPIVYLTVGGWDTHVNQLPQHQRLLKSVGDSLAALMNDLKTRGSDGNVLIMVQTEFGRRVAQNGSGGTDHGTATPVFFLGNNLKGGILGGQPNLDSLVNGNLPWQIDFRSLYAETIDRWLHGNSVDILGGSFPYVEFLA